MRRLASWTVTSAAAALIAAGTASAAGEAGHEMPSQMGAPAAETPADPSVDAPPPAPADRAHQTPAMQTAEGEYVVQKGDTLAEIAQSELGNAGKWQVIARANDIDEPEQLRVGQRLKIPKDEAAQGAPPRPEL